MSPVVSRKFLPGHGIPQTPQATVALWHVLWRQHRVQAWHCFGPWYFLAAWHQTLKTSGSPSVRIARHGARDQPPGCQWCPPTDTQRTSVHWGLPSLRPVLPGWPCVAPWPLLSLLQLTTSHSWLSGMTSCPVVTLLPPCLGDTAQPSSAWRASYGASHCYTVKHALLPHRTSLLPTHIHTPQKDDTCSTASWLERPQGVEREREGESKRRGDAKRDEGQAQWAGKVMKEAPSSTQKTPLLRAQCLALCARAHSLTNTHTHRWLTKCHGNLSNRRSHPPNTERSSRAAAGGCGGGRGSWDYSKPYFYNCFKNSSHFEWTQLCKWQKRTED